MLPEDDNSTTYAVQFGRKYKFLTNLWGPRALCCLYAENRSDVSGQQKRRQRPFATTRQNSVFQHRFEPADVLP